MAKLLSIETVAGLSKVKEVDDPLFQGWLEKIARTTEQQSRLLRQVPTGTMSPQAPASGLLVDGNSLTSIVVTANEVWLKDVENNPEIITAFSEIVTFTGALDTGTGAITASTWYYVWLVYNGSTAKALISASSTAPLMPAGYTHKGLLSAIRIDAASALVRSYTLGHRTAIAAVKVLTAGTAASATAINISTAAPPIGRRVLGYMQLDASVAAARAAQVSLDGVRGIQLLQDNVSSTAAIAAPFHIAYAASQIFYQVLVVNDRLDVFITAWEF